MTGCETGYETGDEFGRAVGHVARSRTEQQSWPENILESRRNEDLKRNC